MRLADSHVHLHAYSDVAGLIARARAADVDLMVGIGIDLATSRRTIEIARSQPEVVAAVGLHPARLVERSGAGVRDAEGGSLASVLSQLEVLARDPKVGFIGEIGLDVVDGKAGIAYQRQVFEEQLSMAQRLGRPVNLHVQGAFDDAFRVLERVGVPKAGAVVHYFVGDETLARRALDLGLYISVGKPITRISNDQLRRAVRAIPLERLLLETDSYPLPGRTTEPANVRLVAQAVANVQGCTLVEVAEVTTANLSRLLAARR